MNNLKQQLEQGLIAHFDNEQWCEDFESDDFRGGRVEFRRFFGVNKEFAIWFNGTIVHSCKTFKSCERKLNELFDRFGCKITDINDEL